MSSPEARAVIRVCSAVAGSILPSSMLRGMVAGDVRLHDVAVIESEFWWRVLQLADGDGASALGVVAAVGHAASTCDED